jgi:Phosphotransferase enzyme family
LDRLNSIAEQFAGSRQVKAIRAFGSGNINDTFLVTIEDEIEPHFILQRINTHVFLQPGLVMQNMRIFSQHVCDKLQREGNNLARRWAVPRVLLTNNGQDGWIEPDDTYWRAISFIDDSESIDIIQDIEHGREIGYALGRFHHLISDLDPAQLADTLPGFHITPQYLEYYHRVLLMSTAEFVRSGSPTMERTQAVEVNPEVDYCLNFVQERQEWARVLEDAKNDGKLPLRPIHGDPKVNNVMICTKTQQAIGIIDLDTVKPGLVHYDIGDCLRSGCNPLGEETKEWEKVHFDTVMCRSILSGYLTEASGFLTDNDYEYLFDGIRLIAFELGLRFFTDHLAGNVYFKVKYPTHNLDRALVQFKLTESIEAQAQIIQQIIGELRG